MTYKLVTREDVVRLRDQEFHKLQQLKIGNLNVGNDINVHHQAGKVAGLDLVIQEFSL